MSCVAGGKRAGARRAERSGGGRLPTLGYAAAITAAIVAWGYLVFTAINFGALARDGDSAAWLMLVLASLGAVACLFVGLLVGARLLRILGIAPASSSAGSSRSGGSSRSAGSSEPPAPVRTPGGRRALR